MAAAGKISAIEAAYAQIESGELSPIESKGDEDGARIVIVGKRNWALESDNMSPYEVPKTYAIGSGSLFAMAAMFAGADAIQAVKIAARLDVYTGGQVRSTKVFP